MYYYYNLVCGHNQLFVSAIRDNYYRGFDLFMSILEKFVERLRELLTDHEMKPAHLAKELGVTRKVICRYTNGERLPSLNMAFRLSGYFHCSIDFLLGRSDEGSEFEPLPLPPFKDRLPYLVDFFKKTKANISKEAHIDESIIYDWLKGRSTPSLESITALADYFDCSVEFILGREN